MHRYEVHPLRPELVEGHDEMPDRPGEPVESPDGDDIYTAGVDGGHEEVELRTTITGAGDAQVDVLALDRPSSLFGETPKAIELKVG